MTPSANSNQVFSVSNSLPGQANLPPAPFPFDFKNTALYQVVTVKQLGAAGDGVSNDTVAIARAITLASLEKGTVVIPKGTYSIFPATLLPGADGPVTTAFVIPSNLNLQCSPGAVLKMADNQSTDAAPKRLAMFMTVKPVSHIIIDGCTFDMNGANNRISPNRPLSYNYFNQAVISVEGDHGRADDVLIENSQFMNTAGTNFIVAAKSNTPGIALGSGWTIQNCVFSEGGTDADDFTAIYAWANNVSIADNQFSNSTPPGTVGKTGAQTAFEIHGSDSTAYSNKISNYARGAYVSNNYTSVVDKIEIYDNVMSTTFEAIDVVSLNPNSHGASNVKIHDNVVTLTEKLYRGSQNYQAAFPISSVSTQAGVQNVDIANNQVNKPGTRTMSSFLVSVIPSSGVRFTNIRVHNNTASGLTVGVFFSTEFGGSLGAVESAENRFSDLTEVPGRMSIGTFVNASYGIDDVVIRGNTYVDDRGTLASFAFGDYLTSGSISNFYAGQEVYHGLTIADYTEAGGIRILDRNGQQEQLTAPTAVP